MFSGQEEYFREMLVLVKKEISLYTKYAVRLKENGGIRHIYNTKLFRDELSNVMEDPFAHMDRKSYDAERGELFAQWHGFHEKAYRTMKEGGELLPFEYMLRRLGLNGFEQYIACLSMAPELNREFERMYSYLQDDLAWRYPSLDLCIKMYTMNEQEQNTLIHQVFARRELLGCVFSAKPPTQESELAWRFKLRENLVEYVFFHESDLQRGKAPYCLKFLNGETEPVCNINLQTVESLCRRLQEEAKQAVPEEMRLFFLRGPLGSGKKLQISLAAKRQGQSALFLDMKRLACQKEEQMKEAACDSVVRAVLDHAFLVFDHWEAVWAGEKRNRQAAFDILRRASLFFGDVFFTVEEGPGEDVFEGEYPAGYGIEEFWLRFPSIRERSLLFQIFLKEAGWQTQEEQVCDTLAAQFDFTPGAIRDSVWLACRNAAVQGEKQVPTAFLYQACQQKISHKLGERASRVNAAYSWDDLVLEEGPKGLLRQACGQISCRGKVYEEWGFADKIAYGRGVSLLFAGPPGTGKTMAAQVLAKELNLELYKVDLSGVLSKYIGETQKNLREIFDEVKKSRSILFFDEADVLFGKRVDVSDARDMSANAQTAYLLQKMEEYDGITILATNLMQNFDDAYKRRMKYIIRFTFPQKEQRALLWEKVFPAKMPLAGDIDIEYLADNFELSGASIKNIAVNEAFLAASRQEITGMEHIMTALQQEYEKSGKILGKAELQEYYIYKI